MRRSAKIGAISLLRLLTTYDANIGWVILHLKYKNFRPTMRQMHGRKMAVILSNYDQPRVKRTSLVAKNPCSKVLGKRFCMNPRVKITRRLL